MNDKNHAPPQLADVPKERHFSDDEVLALSRTMELLRGATFQLTGTNVAVAASALSGFERVLTRAVAEYNEARKES